MKDILNVIIPIVLLIFIALICCKIFIKPNILKFQETSNFRYIETNKDNIEMFLVRTNTLLGEHCYEIEIDKGYDVLKNISIKKETKMHTTDSDMYLEIYFDNGTLKNFYFEGDNLVYGDKKYELNSRVVLFNKDNYMPNEITKTMIIISSEDEIECR